MTKICCFTGHRTIKNLPPIEVLNKLKKVLVDLIENEGFCDFRTGGAIGFDTMAALTILELKKKYPHIKLHLFLPYKSQDSYFTPQEKQVYHYTIACADSVTYTQNSFSKEALFARNRALVDGTDLCVAYLERLDGGTYYTVNYARKQRVNTINLFKS